MTDPYMKYMQNLHSLFNEDFMAIYNEATPKKRKRMLPYMQACYRRWYYSTLIENIHFSPANLASSIGNICGMPTDTYLVTEITQPISKFSEIGLKVLTYTIDNHPVVEDLRKIVDFCTPHIDLCEEWCFCDNQAQKVAKTLSQQDPYYASFLLEVAYSLEILERMPSLYVQRMQVSEIAPEILALPNAELFHKIVDNVIHLTAIGLQNTLPVPVSLFTEDGIRKMLADPITVDDILDHSFAALGYDLDGLLTQDTLDSLSDLMEEDSVTAEMINGIFILGIMLDRLFFTPFGSFLRIVRPVYSIPFNLEPEMLQHINSFDEDDDFAAFFAPCTSYTLTDIGLTVLNIEPTENNYFDTNGIVTKDVLDSMLFTSPVGIRIFVKAARDAIPLSEMPDSIYTFRVQFESDPKIWVNMQISKTATLHNLYDHILDEFYMLDEEGPYSFYHSQTPNRFTEYVSATDIEKFRKAKLDKRKYSMGTKHTHVQLSALDFEHEQHLLLMLSDPNRQNFMLEWLGETAINPKERYPKLVDVSDGAQAIFKKHIAERELEMLDIFNMFDSDDDFDPMF